MTVLITGAGLVASYVARALQDRGIEIALYDLAPALPYLATILNMDKAKIYTGDITHLPALTHIAQEHQVTCIVHTAAWIGAMVSREPYRGVEINVGGCVAVIEAARIAGVPRVVFCSSVAIYDFTRLPEKVLITEDAPIGPKNLYGATKLAGEHLLTQYGKIYDIEVVHLRLAGVFGRGQYVGGSWMGRVLNQVLEDSLEARPAVLKPEWIGTQEYVYVKDVAQALSLACLSEKNMSGAYNIGTGVLHSYSDVVAEIKRLLPDAKIGIEESNAPIASYLERTQAFDISKAVGQLGYHPQFSFQTGLQDYVDELRKFSKRYSKST